MRLDVGPLLDRGTWTPRHSLLVAGTALTIVLDGLDNQLLGNAIPSLMQEWSMPRSAFSTSLAMSPLGMMIGGGVGGWLGDRIGRRSALLASVLTFAALTAVTSAAGSMAALSALRFIAGLGLGGALPNAAALASEYVPQRQRPFAVTLTIVCVPLGGMLAAFLSGRVIPVYGWRPLFLAGGLVPFLLGVILFKILPESPRYLAARRERWTELIGLLRQLGHTVPPDTTFTEAGAVDTGKPPTLVRGLFAPVLRRDTLALFGAFFFCLLANYIGFLLLVPALTGAGFTQPAASDVLGWWNIGGVGGALAGALFIQRFGSKVTMLGLSAIAVASAGILATMPLDPQNMSVLLPMCIVLGGTLNAVQTTMYALAAHVYPAAIRATGVGTAVAFGRIGGVASPYAGAWALESGGPSQMFTLIAGTLTVVFAALASVRNHIPRHITTRPAAAMAAEPARR
jgi:AAHS family 4-hydroxybenzoate transporter-like MFS transporter